MRATQVKVSGLQEHRTGPPRVASGQRAFLIEVFCWATDPMRWPTPLKERPRSEFKKKRKRRQLRAYQSLLERVARLRRDFPQDEPLRRVSSIVSDGINELRNWVTYGSRDGYSWSVQKGGAKPAIGPRLLLAVCIAKTLWPGRSPYQAVAEQLGFGPGTSVDAIENQKRAIEKQIFRVIKSPEKSPVYGAPRTSNVLLLLRQELLDFKIWKEQQREGDAEMSIEEFDAHFNEYLDRIHPTPEEDALLAGLLEQFLQTSRTRSHGTVPSQRSHVDSQQ